jgi:hypothetical protein
MAPRQRRKKNANGEGGVYRRADGRWEAKAFVDTPDGRRKRVSIYGDTEREALNELNKLRDHQRRGIPVATTTLTVAQYTTYWLEHIAEPSIRRTTYATYEGDVRLHIVPNIGKRKLKTFQATVQRILRHSSITVATGTYVEVIEAVQRDALDSMGTLFAHLGDGS